jgi:hypothetical protein
MTHAGLAASKPQIHSIAVSNVVNSCSNLHSSVALTEFRPVRYSNTQRGTQKIRPAIYSVSKLHSRSIGLTANSGLNVPLVHVAGVVVGDVVFGLALDFVEPHRTVLHDVYCQFYGGIRLRYAIALDLVPILATRLPIFVQNPDRLPDTLRMGFLAASLR